MPSGSASTCHEHVALADVDRAGAEREQSLELGILVAVGRVEVEVDAVLVLLDIVVGNDAGSRCPTRRRVTA